MKKFRTKFSVIFLLLSLQLNAQQISIPRIDKMPDMPSPYVMRDWKQVAIDYDNFIFDTSKTGTYLPLCSPGTSGVNYSDVQNIRMDTYVGQTDHGNVAEAVNLIPAVVGASLVGVDKTNHLNTNWVKKLKDFYNLENGQDVYLNGYSSTTGNDWWYEIMPSVFFYQLYALYPAADSDFETQFTTIADRELNVLYELGGKLQPWTAPQMNYRAFNLLTGKPNATSVPEPESAGSIAWILYQAYVQTGEVKYLQGAELALDFLLSRTTNPSYEIQLPYGIATAARMNAVEGTNYDIQKMLNWTFSSGLGTLRGWGTIVGNWNGYDVSGLIGEANDNGNDYAFCMNGFQHAATLAPVVKYDKRFANAIGKWILNLANASRLFYTNGLPVANQEASGNAWEKQYDPSNCIPFESIKQTWNGVSPFARGDAVNGGWAKTDLSLYSGSSVGYMASIIAKTNVDGILQIDLNKTDFRGENTYPFYLYYNPYTTTKSVEITLPAGQSYDLYDDISESVIKTNVSGTVSFDINPGSSRIIVVIPPNKSKQTVGRIRKIYNGGVIDYHYGYNYSNPLRIKAFTCDTSKVVNPDIVTFNCLIENNTDTPTYNWYENGNLIATNSSGSMTWTAPKQSGIYTFKCDVTSNYKTVTSNEIQVTVAPEGTVTPEITDFTVPGADPYGINNTIYPGASITPDTAKYVWQCSGGELQDTSSLTPKWTLPSEPGVYTISLTVSNMLGKVTSSKSILVKDLNTSTISTSPIIYYPFNGDTRNYAQDHFDAVNYNATLTTDERGNADSAYSFAASSQYIATPNDAALNFTDKITVSLWIKPDILPDYEQFVISHGSYEQRYKMSIIPDETLRWTLKTSTGLADVDDTIPSKVGEFVHFTGVYTGYSLELYRNGKFVAYKPLSGTIGTSTKSITLARKDESETNYNFRGTIDEVRIYDAALPVNYISKLPNMWNLTSGVDAIHNSSIKVLPNPFDRFFSVILPDNNNSFSVDIMNLQGQKIWSGKNIHNGEMISASQYMSSGIYILSIETENGTRYISKLIKK